MQALVIPMAPLQSRKARNHSPSARLKRKPLAKSRLRKKRSARKKITARKHIRRALLIHFPRALKAMLVALKLAAMMAVKP
jgi:hypothetical protein